MVKSGNYSYSISVIKADRIHITYSQIEFHIETFHWKVMNFSIHPSQNYRIRHNLLRLTLISIETDTDVLWSDHTSYRAIRQSPKRWKAIISNFIFLILQKYNSTSCNSIKTFGHKHLENKWKRFFRNACSRKRGTIHDIHNKSLID